jgi:hypothetical protein
MPNQSMVGGVLLVMIHSGKKRKGKSNCREKTYWEVSCRGKMYEAVTYGNVSSLFHF